MTRYFFHDPRRDRHGLRNDAPEDVERLPIGWHPAAEAAREAKLAELAVGLSTTDQVLVWVPAHTTAGGQTDPARWREIRIRPWTQPTGAHDAHPLGAIMLHDGKRWESLVDANVWEPGVAAWREIVALGERPPQWVQPSGASDAYRNNELVWHDGAIWRSLGDGNTSEPGAVGTWRDQAVPPRWVAPAGSVGMWQAGDRAVYDRRLWESAEPNNVWTPGEFGWVEVVE